MAAASEDILKLLHNAVALELIERIKGKKKQDAEGNEITIEASGSDLTNAIKMLKDNNITCTPAADNALGALAQQLKNRGEASIDEVDLANALNEVGHSAMRPN